MGYCNTWNFHLNKWPYWPKSEVKQIFYLLTYSSIPIRLPSSVLCWLSFLSSTWIESRNRMPIRTSYSKNVSFQCKTCGATDNLLPASLRLNNFYSQTWCNLGWCNVMIWRIWESQLMREFLQAKITISWVIPMCLPGYSFKQFLLFRTTLINTIIISAGLVILDLCQEDWVCCCQHHQNLWNY